MNQAPSVMKRICAPALVLACLTIPAAGQEWTVLRNAHTFIGRLLTIDVDVDAPGTLLVARGGAGRIVVVTRARRGIGESGLTGRADDRLTLTAIGTDSVEFLVFVPVDVRTTVQLPDGGFPELVSDAGGVTYRWPARRGADSVTRTRRKFSRSPTR